MKMFDLAWCRGKFKFSKKPSCMLDWGLLLLKNRVVKIALNGFSLKLPKQKSENGVWFNLLFFFHRGVQREALISFWVWHESQGAGLSLHWSLCKKQMMSAPQPTRGKMLHHLYDENNAPHKLPQKPAGNGKKHYQQQRMETRGAERLRQAGFPRELPSVSWDMSLDNLQSWTCRKVIFGGPQDDGNAHTLARSADCRAIITEVRGRGEAEVGEELFPTSSEARNGMQKVTAAIVREFYPSTAPPAAKSL